MDGVLMKKLGKLFVIFAVLAAFCWFGTVIADREKLHESLVRLHIVANSDGQEDQNVKLQVRDAIIGHLYPVMEAMPDIEQAKMYLQNHLSDLEAVANQALREAGSLDTAKITFALEEFPKRVYDTFTLPAGVYESLRIEIGEGKGQNWWCVIFPQLCLPATSDGFQDAAVSSGFSDTLTNSLTGEYEVRFFLLDCLGALENFFYNP